MISARNSHYLKRVHNFLIRREKIAVNSTLIKEPMPKNSVITETLGVDVNLLSDIVHKIRNGLGGIDGFASLLERDLNTDDPRKRLVHRIHDGVTKINDIVADLMMLARPVESVRNQMDVELLVKNVLRDYWGCGATKIRNLAETLHLSGKTKEIYADPDMIHTMIFYTIRFIHRIADRIEKIEIKQSIHHTTTFKFIFYIEPRKIPIYMSIAKMLNEYEPIDARLSLAIIIKMVQKHSGKVCLYSISENQKIFTINL